MAIDFPDSPTVDQQYSVGDRTWTWNGTYWQLSQTSSTFTASDTAPINPSAGDIWFESDTGQTFIYYDQSWVEIGAATDLSDILSDADADTSIQVEASSDEDVIRFKTAGVERLQLTSDGHLVPQANVAYDLGSDTNRFRDLYLSGSSIDLGGVEITSDGTNISLPNVDDVSANTVSANSVQVGSEYITPYTGRRNLLYNGAMQVAQRGTSTTGISSATHQYYTADRYTTTVLNAAGTWTNSVETDAPAGFGKSLKLTCTTATLLTNPTAAAFLAQKFEGQDLQCIAKGTSSAKQLTLSFWVKSNVTGTYVVSLYDFDNSGRTVSKQYTVSSADTWEHKTLTYPADTTGALNNDNGVSLQMTIWLAGGSNYTSGTLNETWNSYVAANEAVGHTNLGSAVNNYIQITGVQLELGDKATPFEHRTYADELKSCQRYYIKSTSVATSTQYISGVYYSIHEFPFPMRANPSITLALSSVFYLDNNGSWVNGAGTPLLANYGAIGFINIRSGVSTGFPVGSGVLTQAGDYEANAEL